MSEIDRGYYETVKAERDSLQQRLAASEKEVERLTEETKHLWDYNNQRQSKIEALEQRVSECEGLLRKCKTDGDEYTNEDGCAFCMMVPTDEDGPLKWKHVSTCIIVEIDAYFERRKP